MVQRCLVYDNVNLPNQFSDKSYMRFFYKFFLLSSLICTSWIYGQRTTIYIDPVLEYKNGLELFDKKLYNAAQKSFQNVVFQHSDKNSLLRVDAEFFAAACAIELFHKDGELRCRNFIQAHPESNRVKWAYFYLGKSNFRKKKYEEVIKWLEQVSIYDLNKEDQPELYFKRGYAFFETKNFEKAKTDFYEIKDIDNKYARPANYYFSHISYLEKNFETAAQGFRRLISDETFGMIVPYYIFQIYFIQEKYDSVITLAPKLLSDTMKVLQRSEISKIVGESYYRKKEFAKAIDYLKDYGRATPEDEYVLGFCYYKTENKQEAGIYFSNAINGNDTIAQNAWYHLADCQLSSGEKSKARNSFYQAWKTGTNESIKEDALYSFAKISYELSLSPYNEAINAFTTYLKEYPQSFRKDEAYKYLVNVFASTQNYLEAMKAIDKIANADLSLRTIYQRMAWNYGVTLFNSGKNDSARFYFNTAITNGYDARVTALANYWDAEIDYRDKKYNEAINKFKLFQVKPAAAALNEYDNSNYAIAYCYFAQKDYSSARNFFDLYLKRNNGEEKMADAAARLGDCWFMLGNFSSASDEYEHAIHLSKADNEYCLYQKAICSGRQKKYQEKIADLKLLLQKFPGSTHMKTSYLEIAEAYVRDNQYDNAIQWYRKYMSEFPNSGQENSINAQIGVLWMNKNDNEKAMEVFLELLKKDPKSQESQLTALPNIKTILLSQGKTDEWEKIANENGITINRDEIEEATYSKARDQYMVQKNCDRSLPECEKYMTKFPDGPHIQEIRFWLAECSFAKNDFEKALPSYLYLIQLKSNSFTETALTKSAFILFKNQQYSEALPLYLRLQTEASDPTTIYNSKINAMRCAWNSKNYPVSVEQSTMLIKDNKTKPELVLEARIIRAGAFYETAKYSEAMEDYKTISKTAENLEGAKALYFIASIHLKNSSCKEVEKTIDKLMTYKYGDKYWMTKGLLLMCDCYISQKKFSDAEALLHTIIDNQPDSVLLQEANDKLNSITQLQQSRISGQENELNKESTIEFQNKTADKDLFDELIDKKLNNSDSTNIIKEPK